VFLCEKENPTSELRQAMTKQLDKWLIECARKLNDGKIWTLVDSLKEGNIRSNHVVAIIGLDK
jgi:hypothetical protein